MALPRENLSFWLLDAAGVLLFPRKKGVDGIGDMPGIFHDLFVKSQNSKNRSARKSSGSEEFSAQWFSVGKYGDLFLVVERKLDDLHETISELRTKNLELEAIIESSHDGFVVADANGILLKINDNYTKATGLSKDQLIGKNVHDEDLRELFSPSGTALVLEKNRQ